MRLSRPYVLIVSPGQATTYQHRFQATDEARHIIHKWDGQKPLKIELRREEREEDINVDSVR